MIVHQLIPTRLYWKLDWESEKNCIVPGHQKMGWLQSQVLVAKNLAMVEFGSNTTIHYCFATCACKEDMIERTIDWLQLIPHCYF